MKKYISIIALSAFYFAGAQINTPVNIAYTISGEHAFFDASGFSKIGPGEWDKSEAKGLIFPQVDLTQFRFNADNVATTQFPTAFDGMIVYNIGSGPIADPKLATAQENVEPGFYYFHNPGGKTALEGGSSGDVAIAQGKWIPLGSGGGSATIKTSETRLGKIDNVQLYGIKDSFTVNATDGAKVTINFPSGLSSIYSIKIYDRATKKLVASSLSSYDVANNKAVTGMGNMSIPLPPATYDYVLEYFK